MDLPWALVVVVGSAQSLFLCVLLAARRSCEARCLSVVLGALALALAEEAVDLAGCSDRWPAAIGMSLPIELLLGPLLLVFVRCLRGLPLRHLDAIHFVPYFVAQAALIPFLLEPLDVKLASLQGGGHLVVDVVLATKGPVLFAYLIAAWISAPTARVRLVDRLARSVLGALLLLGLGTLALLHARRSGLDVPLDSDRLSGIGLTLLVQVLALTVLWPRRRPVMAAPYESSSLGAARRSVIADRLRANLERERPWLDSKLDLAGLAQQLGVPVHHLSQVINEELGVGYYDLVTQYRVAEAKRLLADEGLAGDAVLDLGFAAGFASKASFYRAFKRATGTTPNEFRRAQGNRSESTPVD